MDKQTLMELADRCEAASGADRDIDCLIAREVGAVDARTVNNGFGYGYVDRNQWACSQVPVYTASLDAAMTLADGYFKLEPDSLKGWRALGKMGPWCHAATPALALTAAALRARAAL